MPREYVGCKAAAEISKVRSPANKLSTHLVAKNDPNTQPKPETTDMDEAAIQKAATAIAEKIAFMSDVEKAHYKTLDEAGKAAYLAKSDEDRLAEANAAKKAKDDALAAAELEKSGKTQREADLEKSNKELTARLEAVEKREEERTKIAAIEKAAADPRFNGFPGGKEAIVSLMKSTAELSEDVRKSLADGWAAQAAAASRFGTTFGATLNEDDISKAAPATARIEKAAKELAKEKSISYQDAWEEVIEKNEYAADVAAMQNEARVQ